MICPRCGSRDTADILYGLPTFEAAEDQGVVLGGCEPRPEDRACQRCGLRFVAEPA